MPLLLAATWLACACQGENLAPNPSFETGGLQPESWELKYGPGQWETSSHTGARSVSVTGTNDCGAVWRTVAGISVEPGQIYVMRYQGMAVCSWGGTGLGEIEGAGWRRTLLSEGWADYSLAVVMPTNLQSPRLRVGQCAVNGTVYFDDIELKPALAVHTRSGGHVLGLGESFQTNRYTSEARMADLRSNHSRNLHAHTAVFGGDEWSGKWFWDITSSTFVTYRHHFDGIEFTNARVRVTLSFSYGGDVVLDASPNGQDWQEIARFSPAVGDTTQVVETNLPPSLLPATELFIRIRATVRANVNGYRFEADTSTPLPQAEGGTWFFEKEGLSDIARPVAMADTPAGHVLSVLISNTNTLSRTFSLRCSTEGAEGTRESQLDAVIPGLSSLEVGLPLPAAGPGENVASIEVRDQTSNTTALSGSLRMQVAAIRDDSYGSRLAGPDGCAVWWCDGTYKVGRERNAPMATNSSVIVAAARNEYEPFQIVLRPEVALSNVSVSVSDFVCLDPPGVGLSATNVEVCLVEYVPVTEPTDRIGIVGDHPDPLVPLTGPISLRPGINHPFWFTVHVPANAQPGAYSASVTFASDAGSFAAAIALRVFRFALPETTHTRTAYELYLEPRWHNWVTAEQYTAVWHQYMQNFSRHRISPTRPSKDSPVSANYEDGRWTYDFAAFDAAVTVYLEEYRFNGFAPIEVPWWRTGYETYSNSAREAYARRTQPMVNHLREKGWLDEAYLYAFDEPQPSAYASVREATEMLLQIAPGMRRLVTTVRQPEVAFNGHVDIQVPYLPYLDTGLTQERLTHGDEIWWYVCTGPKAPWPNNFIDHPAISHRIRVWLAQKYGLAGELYWNTALWTTTNGLLRNPWTDPMSRHASLGVALGNGDGALLYPPVRTPPTQPVIAGPINSLRWELQREAMEDGEYFWLLNQMIQRAERRLGPEHALVADAQSARAEALGLVASRTTFERGAQKLYAARLRLAEAIEKLDNGAPMIVSHPRSKAVTLHSTINLRVETLGWPLPAYQWRLNGTDISGATNALLSLKDCGPLQTGSYTVVAFNSLGAVTSTVAQVEGYWAETPRIIASPSNVVRWMGDPVVLAITAVSTNPMSYQWLHNGHLVTETVATNNTLTFTNAALNHAGDYSVIISNGSGMVTSSSARLTILSPTTTLSLVPTGASWRYHDQGVDLGTAWREASFDDSGWSNGLAQFGYGEGDESTSICSGTSSINKPPTTYFRLAHYSSEAIPAAVLRLRLLADDAAVVYLNGTEIYRDNLPEGPVSFTTSALSPRDGSEETRFLETEVPGHLLQLGTNVIAVEIHQYTSGSPLAFQPAAFWSFDEAGPTWIDSVGANHFSLVGTRVVAMPGKVGGCASNSYSYTDHLQTATATNIGATGPFTVGGWFAVGPGTDARAAVLEKTGEFALYYAGSSINRYRFEVNGAAVQDQTSIALGQWRFIVGWFDGTNANIQVNNGAVYSAPVSAPQATTNALVALKKRNVSGGLAADEMFFYNRGLTADERTTLYTTGIRAYDLSFDFELTGAWGQVPEFVSAPLGVARFVGGNAAFSLTAMSGSPVSYQWNFNGTPIPSATNSLLFLEGVTLASAGDYTLTARNLAGSATSSPATLHVFDVPQLSVQSLITNAGFILEVPACELPCTVLVSSNLVDWSELAVLPPSLNATNLVNLNNPAAPSRFYQLRLQP